MADTPATPAVHRDVTGVAPPWRAALTALVTVSVALTLASYITLELVDHPFFDVGGGGHAYLNVGVEGNIPTWWSAAILAAGATTAALVTWLGRRSGTGAWWTTAFLAALMLAFSVDEAAGLHEQLYRLGDLLISRDTVPYVWLAVGIPLALVILGVVVVVARHLSRPVRRMVVGGLTLFFLGAVGLELVGSQLVATRGETSGWVVAAYHLEELCEMVGAAMVAVAPLRGLEVSTSHGSVTVSTVASP